MPAKQIGKIIFQTLASRFFRNKTLHMFVNMADEMRNAYQFFHHFTIPVDALDAQIPRPWPYLFHRVGTQNQFPHYLQPPVLMYIVLALNCQDFYILSHPPHLPRHKSHPLSKTPSLLQK